VVAVGARLGVDLPRHGRRGVPRYHFETTVFRLAQARKTFDELVNADASDVIKRLYEMPRRPERRRPIMRGREFVVWGTRR
jgi:hypothetical protein